MSEKRQEEQIFEGITYSLNDYKIAVSLVCSYLADLNACLDDIEHGEKVSKEYVLNVSDRLEESKDKLLEIKEALGLERGVEAFQKDLNLFGAEFKNGRFTVQPGHEDTYRRETLTSAKMFIDQFPQKGSCFTYEQMVMVSFFCYPLPKERYKKVRKSFKDLITGLFIKNKEVVVNYG